MKKTEISNSIFFLLLALAILYFSKDMKSEFYTIGPAFFPQMLGISLILANIPRLIAALRLKREEKTEKNSSDRHVYLTISIMIFYLGCTYFIGTLLSSILLIYILMHYLGNRSQFQKAIFSLGVPLAVKAIFKWVLVLPLPNGILDFI